MLKKILNWILLIKRDPDYEIIKSEFVVGETTNKESTKTCLINGVEFHDSESIKVQYKRDWCGGVLVFREGRSESNKGWCVLDGAYNSRSLDHMDAIQKIKSESYEKA